MKLSEIMISTAPFVLGLAFAVLLGVCALRPGRCVRPKWARKLDHLWS